MKRFVCLLLCVMLLPWALPALAEQGSEIPAGFPRPVDVRFVKGQKYPVWSGPGEQYLRAGKGKGVLSTNGWVQVFGQEGGWLLVHYGISQKQLRFGYISASALPKGAAAPALDWEEADAAVGERSSLTDDPLASQAQTAVLEAGATVRRLGALGEWAYVEARTEEGWARGFVMDAALSKGLSRDASKPFDLRASSWGRLGRDHATTRYFLDPSVGRYQEEGAALPNVWLRLDSTESAEDLETLGNFRVVSGRASCAPLPVPLAVSGMDNWGTVHFLQKEGFRRGALEITLEEGELLGNVTLACDRQAGKGSAETLTLPLQDVPEDAGYPAGGTAFTLLRCTRFARSEEQMREFQPYAEAPDTLGAILEDLAQPMPEAPAEVLSLPYDTPEYSFWLLEGLIEKQPGDFGVYDVTFSLERPPEGLYIAAYQECGLCSEIDAFDMSGGEVYLIDPESEGDDHLVRIGETLEREFAILMLVNNRGRDDAQIEGLIRELNISAAFSVEKWNISYEQHLVTSAIGPRSRERVRMVRLAMAPGLLSEIPD